ncbi:MAG: hypothetical protein R2697_05685 [Ilumatobacteraceae bacterium]
MNAAIEELVAELGDDVVATDDISERYRTDWTGTSPPHPPPSCGLAPPNRSRRRSRSAIATDRPS